MFSFSKWPKKKDSCKVKKCHNIFYKAGMSNMKITKTNAMTHDAATQVWQPIATVNIDQR